MATPADGTAGGSSSGGGDGVTLDLEKTHFDAIITGTGLTESILAAALASAGHSVLHVDTNGWYGSAWASLSLRELIQWARNRPQESGSGAAEQGTDARYTPQLSFPAFSHAGTGVETVPKEPPAELVALDRHYALSLCPTLLPAAGATIDVLIRSGVASYCTFRMLEHTFVYESADPGAGAGALKRVPSSKEDIFKDRSISLPDKRRLMKVLTEVASSLEASSSSSTSDQPFINFLRENQGLSSSLASALSYGVALCASQEESTTSALAKMHTHLRSIGKYGQGAYLVGQYGGAGELAQGYCRCSAVNGGTYILGHRIRSAQRLPPAEGPAAAARWEVDIEGNKVTSNWLVLDQDSSHLVEDSTQSEGATEDAASDVVFGHIVLNRPFRLPKAASAAGSEGPEEGPKPLPPETALVVFPASAEGGQHGMTTYALMNGEGTFSTPKGQYIYYLMTSVPRSDPRSAARVLQGARDRVLALTDGAREEWKMPTSFEAGAEDEGAAVTTAPLPPLVEAYHRRRIPSSAPISDASSASTHLLRVPFPPTNLPPPFSSSSAPALPNLATSLDRATQLAEELFWTIGGGPAARKRAEAARKKVARRERDEEEFAGRAVALAGVREAQAQGGETGLEGNAPEGEETEEEVWDFFPKKPAQLDAE
ncbi:hypothetical protein OC835_004719 [Tilletia horrida]|nr:hypothetical protein OC835_004719 [Tilletia horrida]